MRKYNSYYVEKGKDKLKVLLEVIDSKSDGVTSSYFELILKMYKRLTSGYVVVEDLKAIKNPIDYMYEHFSSKKLEDSKVGEDENKVIVFLAKRYAKKKQKEKILEGMIKKAEQRVNQNLNYKIKNLKINPECIDLLKNTKDPVLVEDDRYKSNKDLMKTYHYRMAKKR